MHVMARLRIGSHVAVAVALFVKATAGRSPAAKSFPPAPVLTQYALYRQVGGSFGAAAGLVLMENLPVKWNIQPGIYAIVGATAMLGGVFRSSISLVRCHPCVCLCIKWTLCSWQHIVCCCRMKAQYRAPVNSRPAPSRSPASAA